MTTNTEGVAMGNQPSITTDLVAPRLDRAVGNLTGRALVWLGKRAILRGDYKEFNHVWMSVVVGNTGGYQHVELPTDRTLLPGEQVSFLVPAKRIKRDGGESA